MPHCVILSHLWLVSLLFFISSLSLSAQSSNSQAQLAISSPNMDSVIQVIRKGKDYDLAQARLDLKELESLCVLQERTCAGEIMLLKGELLITESKIVEGLAMIEKAKIEFEKEGNDKGLADVYFGLTMYHKNIADYSNALAVAYQAVSINEGLGANYNLAKTFNQICDILWYQGKFDEGLNYGLKAVDLIEKDGPSEELALAYQLLSDTYLQIADFHVALDYSNQAIDMKHAIGMPPLEITSAYNSRANVYKYLEEYDKAIADYATNLKLCDSLGQQRCIRVSLANLGHVHLIKGEYDKVIPYKLRAIAIQKSTGNVQQINENLDQLCEAYIGIGDYASAYEYRIELDSIIELEYEQNLDALSNDLAVKYETEKNLLALNSLNERVGLQRTIMFLGAGLLALSLIAIFFFKKLNSQLTAKNKENVVLLKEIHHRVKNNLQILSSLLSLQTDHLEDSGAIDALTEGRNRVESMGMIHQRLYSNDDITNVNMKEYVPDLCRHLEDSFSTRHKSISIREDVKYGNMDVDYAIPLGLIINELVTNSVKYAFGDQEEGTLLLELKEVEDKLLLIVSDNGKGDSKNGFKDLSTSFGSKLINILSKKLKGTVTVDTNLGYSTTIVFERYQPLI